MEKLQLKMMRRKKEEQAKRYRNDQQTVENLRLEIGALF
jgi:hypothetical protein